MGHINDDVIVSNYLTYIKSVYERDNDNYLIRQFIKENISSLCTDIDTFIDSIKNSYEQQVKDWLLDNLGKEYEALLYSIDSKLLDQLCNKEKYILIYTLIAADLDKECITIYLAEKVKLKISSLNINTTNIPYNNIYLGKPYICIANKDKDITMDNINKDIIFTSLAINSSYIKEVNINGYR